MATVNSRRAYQRAMTDDFEKRHTFEMLPTDEKHSTKLANVIVEDTSLDFQLQARVSTLSTYAKSVRTRLSGWRMGSIAAALTAGISLILNIAAVAYLKSHRDSQKGLVELYNGDCDKTTAMTVWVHLIINALSTILLGGSNYCMQCLCAPNREEIDSAHAKGKFLDIGVPSLRNLRSIGWLRLSFWWALGLSSVPLHLLYNSAFYSSLAANDYYVYVSTPDFVDGGNATAVIPAPFDYNGEDTSALELQQQIASNDTHVFDRLDPLTCMKAYGDIFLQKHRNLVMVSTNSSDNGSAVLHGMFYSFSQSSTPEHGLYRPYEWLVFATS